MYLNGKSATLFEKAISAASNKIRLDPSKSTRWEFNLEIDGVSIDVCIKVNPVDDSKQKLALPLTRLKELRNEFLRDLKLGVQRKNRGTRKTGISDKDYESRTGLFIRWLEDNNADTVTPQHWIDWYASLQEQGLKPTTIRNYYRNVNGFAAWLVENNHLNTNHLANIVPPVVPKKSVHAKAIPVKHIKTMLKYAANPRDKAILTFFRDTGCRIAEATALKWEDIETDNLRVHLHGKGLKPRTVPIKKSTVKVLGRYKQRLSPTQQTGDVWHSKQSGPLTASGIYQVFSRIAKRAEISDKTFNPHAWRHAFGRDMTASGMPTKTLQQIMGHEYIETTSQYSEVELKTLEDAYHKFVFDDDE